MLDNIIKFSIKNKFIIGLMTLFLIIWGLWSATKLPIDAQPDITNNQVQIITLSPTLASQEVEQLVTFPIEQSIVNVPDIEEVRSISRFGLSVITVVFKDEVDIYFARQLINEKLNEVADDIPKGIGKPELAPVSTGLGEVYQYILHPKPGSEDKYSAMDLRTMQDWIVARQLYGIPGVAEINSFGGLLKQYEVAVDPNRLKAMGISIADIFTALEKNNENTGGAYIDKKPNAYYIRGVGRVTSLEDIGNIVVKSANNSVPVLIKNVAEVKFGSAIRYGAMTYNGEKDVVGGVVMMLKGANSNEVVNLVKDKLPTIQQSLPDDIIIEAYLDRTNLVDRAIATVQKNLVEGALIVIFVLVIFLGNLRAGLIVASAIPLSMIFALGMMNLFGVSANLMSLGAIDFGLVVDGSVIVVEATLHHLGLRKGQKKLTQSEMDEEVFQSAAKIRTSAAFGEIIILIVYIPILTLVGIEGKMFRPMAMTVGFAILGALILSFTYIPMMCALFLPKKMSAKKNLSDKLMDFLYRLYKPLLEKVLRFKYAVLAVVVGIFSLSIVTFSRMGSEFIPTLGEGDFAFHCILPQGTSLSQSLETSMQASRIIKEFDEVKMVVGKTGSAEVPTDPMPPEATDMIIILKPQSEWKTQRSYDELGDEMMERLEVIPGVFFEKNQPIQMRFNELMTGIRQDVAVKIFGEDLDELLTYAQQTAKVIQSVEGATSPQVESVDGLPQINIEYDRTTMANYNLNVEDVNAVVSTAFAGKSAGIVYENERRYDLVVRLDSIHRTSIDDVSNLFIPIPGGNQIPLSQVATIDYKLGPAQISREDGKRRIVVGFNVKDRDIASVVKDIQTKLGEDVKLPTGYYYTFGGQFENLEKATTRLLIAVPISLALIFILLYFTFHSIKEAVLVFCAIPMSAIGGIFALWLRDMPFSISAGVGFIALFGIAVLNGIVLITTFNRLEKDGVHSIIERIRMGTETRLRPVLMTAAVASLGFLPMAISNSAGAEVQKPLATVVIGGLVSATLLTLFILPVLYHLAMRPWRVKKPSTTLIVLLVAGLWGVGSSASAQTTPLTLEAIIETALKNNATLQANDFEIKSSEVTENAQFELPKLQVNTQLEQTASRKFDNQFQVAQSIPFPSLFKHKKALNKEETKQLVLAKEMNVVELKKQLRSYFYQWQYFEFNAKELVKLNKFYEDFITIAKVRFKAGDIKRIEINTAETKQGEIQLTVEQNEVYRKNAYQNLKSLMQTENDFTIEVAEQYQPLQLEQLVDAESFNGHPSIQAYLQEATIADARKKVEKSQNQPEFTLGYTNQSIIGYQNVNGQDRYYDGLNRFHAVNVGIAIPLTSKASRARVEALDYQKKAAESNAVALQYQFKNQWQITLDQYEFQNKQFSYYKEKALPNADLIVKAAQLGYRAGEISYIEYMYALEVAINTQQNYLQTIETINQSVVALNALINH